MVVGLLHLGGSGGCLRSPWWMPFHSFGADCPCLHFFVWFPFLFGGERAKQAATQKNGEHLFLRAEFVPHVSKMKPRKRTPPPRREGRPPPKVRREKTPVPRGDSDSGKPATQRREDTPPTRHHPEERECHHTAVAKTCCFQSTFF